MSLTFASRVVIAASVAALYGGLVSIVVYVICLFSGQFDRTPAQVLFAILLLGFGPVLSASVFAFSEPVLPLRTCAAPMLATWLGLAVGEGIARACFPHYPRLAPHELIAMGFVAPGVVSGGVAWTAALRRAGLPIRGRFVALAIMGVVVLGWTVAAYRFFQLPIRETLPVNARNIRVDERDDGFVGVSLYAVRASIAPAAFERYVRELKLQPVAGDLPDRPELVHPEWWTPPHDGTIWKIVDGDGACSCSAAYAGGEVYVLDGCSR